MRRVAIAGLMTLALAMGPAAMAAADGSRRPMPTPGSPGIGDPYFPLDGNGGYDVDHYDLDLRYDPATGVLQGEARIRARATQDLSRFDLDLQGLEVDGISVDGRAASWVRNDAELIVTPSRAVHERSTFVTTVRYHGVPAPIVESVGLSGFIATDDGALIAGQPHVAATWFPVNDHPQDAATYDFDVTVPAGTEVVANGILAGSRTRGGWTTWSWRADDPMASYLATATIGQFVVHAYRQGGIRYWDAIDPTLFVPPFTPRTGSQVAFSQAADNSYKRWSRTIPSPAGGATLSFWVSRSTETDWDHFFVEAHHPGADDWTTLPDAGGATSDSTGNSCPFWLGLHPFLTHYQTDLGDGTCSPVGTPPASGAWNAVSGEALDWTQWTVDLGAYAGGPVEVALTYASDDIVQTAGVAIDDIVVSTGEGTTSFEADADPVDGWSVPGSPAGSPGNANDWIVAGQADLPTTTPGDVAAASFARQPEILDFLGGYFGRYPFDTAGGIVDDVPELGFALENQTRPIYSPVFFTDSVSGDSVVVHELTHQWFGDDLRLRRWKDIWLNEGFATYAEWLWSEHEGMGTPQEIFDFYATVIPADDPFWSLPIGDPGPALLFEPPVYLRGGMTLHALRQRVGDDAFFKIVRAWARRQSGAAVSTEQFIALAESIAHQDLGELFDTWLYTPAKPPELEPAPSARVAVATAAPAVAAAELRRWPIARR